MSKTPNPQLKEKIIQLGTLYGRLTIGELAEDCHEDQKYIKSLLMEMISNREIPAKYFESSQSVVFEQVPSSSKTNEINGSTELNHTSIKPNIPPKMEVGDIFEFKNKRYRILKQIGKGGMGRILLAIDQEESEQIVVKCLLFDRYRMNELGYSSCEEYWIREQEIIQKQSQSGFPAMHLVGGMKGFQEDYYILLEYIDGISLDKWFPPRVTYPDLPEIFFLISKVLIPLCNHLIYVHSSNILHRDITPKNVMIAFRDNKITPILIDWGVAKEVDHPHFFHPPKPFFTETRIQATGIHSVMNPPEILLGLEPVAASDIYMLGGIMFYLFTGGKIPTLPVTQAGYVMDPKKYNPNLPQKVNELVVQMTQYEPADRIQYIHLVKDQLQQILDENVSYPSSQETTQFHHDQETVVDKKVITDEKSGSVLKDNNDQASEENIIFNANQIDENIETVDEADQESDVLSTESYNGIPIVKSEYEFLQELTSILKKEIPLITKLSNNFFGVVIQNSHIIILRMFNQNLSVLPESIYSLKKLQILYLSGNRLTDLPSNFGIFRWLRELYLYNNLLLTLPSSIGNLKYLSVLDVEKNKITFLPESLENLKSLRSLWLRGNPLSAFSEKMKKILKKLEKQGCQII